MELKVNDSKLNQKQKAQQLCYSDSTMKRYRDQIKMSSAYIKKKSKSEKMSTQGSSQASTEKQAGTELHIHFMKAGKCSTYYDIKSFFSGESLFGKAFNDN